MKDFPYTPEQLAWLEDLETTEARQGKSVLHSFDDCFCCLGRACVVLGLEKENRFGDDFYSYEYVTRYAPESVWKTLKLRDEAGWIYPGFDGDYDSLAFRNDNGQSFKQIAALIRANPEKVFTNLDDANG